MADNTLDTPRIIQQTRGWLSHAVIGLNLCPFAKAVAVKNQIRYTVSLADNSDALLDELCTELQLLAQADAHDIDTTLLIHPFTLTDFEAYNDFLNIAETAVELLGLAGVLQIASFHPDFQFADTQANDISNATNRSPYPMLHLLREASIEKAVAAFPNAATIFEANIQTMENLGVQGWAALQREYLK